jgi:hypothetical protein
MLFLITVHAVLDACPYSRPPASLTVCQRLGVSAQVALPEMG